MAGSGLTVKQMLQGNAKGTAQVPTQTFYASNVAGTVVPKIGAAQGSMAGKANAGALGGVSNSHVIIWAIVIVGAAFLLHYFNFEKVV